LNPRLATAIANAKRGALSKTSIESAIAKGQGKSVSGAALETVIIEAMLPSSVAAIIECQTDQKARVLQDIRYIINKHGGTVTPTNYLFEKKGRIVFQKREGISADDILDEAVEAGALDVDTDDDDQIIVDTHPSEVSDVAQKIVKALGFSIERSSIVHVPKPETTVSVEDKDAEEVENVINLLEEDPSVQDVYINAVW
jgi:transcriptional/translational regulatory protein YebC/TACO1